MVTTDQKNTENTIDFGTGPTGNTNPIEEHAGHGDNLEQYYTSEPGFFISPEADAKLKSKLTEFAQDLEARADQASGYEDVKALRAAGALAIGTGVLMLASGANNMGTFEAATDWASKLYDKALETGNIVEALTDMPNIMWDTLGPKVAELYLATAKWTILDGQTLDTLPPQLKNIALLVQGTWLATAGGIGYGGAAIFGADTESTVVAPVQRKTAQALHFMAKQLHDATEDVVQNSEI